MNIISQNDYLGFKTKSLKNEYLQIDFLSEAGPRIIRLITASTGENLLEQVPQLSVETPYGLYRFLGGHRLWHAPEKLPDTYIPDDNGLEIEWIPGGVLLTQPTEVPTGICKQLEIVIDKARPIIYLNHILSNRGQKERTLAPWAITQLPLGGVAILPLGDKPTDKAGLLPNRNLALWPYTQIEDNRLEITDHYMLLYGNPNTEPCKIGTFDHRGWAAYLRNGFLLVKRFEPLPELTHPDMGCNVEAYTGHNFIELETLGPLRTLQPGEECQHVEKWEIFSDLNVPINAEGVHEALTQVGLI